MGIYSSKCRKYSIIWPFILVMTLYTAVAFAANKMQFKISPQSLSSALLDFSYQSKVQLVMPGHIAEGYFSPGLAGEYTVNQALSVLLEDTGLRYEFVGEATVTIQRVAPKSVQKRIATHNKQKKTQYYGLEQIIVTAEGREQEIQDLAVAITAISGEDMEKRGVTNADELQVFVPGLTIDATQSATTDFTLRGIGASNDDLTTDPGVVVYIDDVYIPRQGPANLAVYDLDRVEILRGPQATMDGRSTPGGSIRYITRKPTPDFEARYLVDIGNYGRFNNTITINGGLTESLYGQLAFAAFQRDGIMDNLTEGEPNGNDIDNLSARFSLRSVPNEIVEYLLTADVQEADQTGILYSVGSQDGYQLDHRLPPVPLSEPARSARTTFTGHELLDISGLMARANVQHEDYKIAYIFGYRAHDLNGLYDLDQRVEDLLHQALQENSQMRMLELRWVSERKGRLSLTGKLDWSGGFFYMDEDGYAEKLFDAHGLGFGLNVWHQSVGNISTALYGQVGYAITQKLKLIAGLRYAVDDKSFVLRATSTAATAENPLLRQSFVFQDDARWRKWIPRLALSYRISEQTLFYGSVGQAYKPGGFEGTPIDRMAAIDGEFRREVSHNYEAGIKSNLFNNRVRFNLMGFAIDYRDLQVSGFERMANPQIMNAEEVDIRGAELEMEARPSINLHISLGLSFLDAEFRSFQLWQDAGVQDKHGDPVPDTLRKTVNLSAVYSFPETQHGLYSLRADAIYSDEAFDEMGVISWPDHRIFNLWFDYAPYGGRWELGTWIRNFTNETYYRGALSGITAAEGAYARKLEPPKMYGVSLKYFW